MKEISIEEKAKRYDEAIEKMQSMMKSWETLSYNGKTFLQDIKYIFPELKESEDEKIRKSLIKGFKRYFSESVFNGILVKDILAWLEKQGEKGINGKNREIPFAEQKPVEQKFVNNKFKMTKSKKQIILLTQQEGNNEIAFATDSLIHAKNMLALGLAYINELINEDDKESVIPNGNFLSNYFPLEPWSDEQTKRNLINFLKSLGATEIPQASLNRYLTYLEKQGEQKPVVIPKFRIGDIIKDTEDGEVFTIRTITKDKYIYTDDSFDWIKDQDEYELVEQKSCLE